MNILLESMRELKEAPESKWTVDNYRQWPWQLQDEWYNSPERQESFKKEEENYKEWVKVSEQARALDGLFEYLEKLQSKFAAPAMPRFPALNDRKVKGLAPEAVKEVETMYDEISKKAEEVKAAIESAYELIEPKEQELINLKDKLKDARNKILNGKDHKYYSEKEEEIRKEYMQKFLDRTQKPEYTTDAVSYSDDATKYNVKWTESLDEDVESTIPAQPLPHDELFAAIDAVKPGSYVNAGYLNEVTKQYLQAKFTGGRGSEGNPNIRLFKATEIYGRCGIDHEEIQAIKDKRAAGIERVGNIYEIESELGNKIFRVPSTGNELLQIYPRSKGDVKVKYFISLDDEDLREATREELFQYCKPSALASHGEFDPASPMRLNLAKIYWFKNLGHSILR